MHCELCENGCTEIEEKLIHRKLEKIRLVFRSDFNSCIATSLVTQGKIIAYEIKVRPFFVRLKWIYANHFLA